MKVALRLLLSLVVVGALILSGCGKNPHLAGGILYLSQKNFEKAVRELETAVEQEPGNGLAHLKLAMAYAELGETKKAGEEFGTALKLAPKLSKDVEANRKHYWVEHFNEGLRLVQEEKNFEEAASAFEKAIDLDPVDVRALTNLGFCYTQLGELEQARALFEKAFELNPADEASRKNLAGFFEDMGNSQAKSRNYSEAIELYERALDLESDRINCILQLGICHSRRAAAETTSALGRDDYEKALGFYGQVLEKEPDNIDVVYNMGVTNLVLDNLEEAVRLLKKAVDINPKVHEFHKKLGRGYAKIGEQDLAVTELVVSKALDANRGKRLADVDGSISPDALEAKYGDIGDMLATLQELGKPEEIYIYEESSSLVEAWFYWSKGTVVYFVGGKAPTANRVSFLPQEG